MDTYKPFSTIGYNTEPFLKSRLEEFIYSYPDAFYAYIYHPDEKDKKQHYHLYIDPQTRIREGDFLMLRKSFEEPDPSNEEGKPLACMPFRKSNSFEDWYLYGLHDSAYLDSKHLLKSTYDYPPEFVVTNNKDILDDYVSQIDRTKYMACIDKMKFCMDNGMTLQEALSYLRIPYSGMYGFMKLWIYLGEPSQRKKGST